MESQARILVLVQRGTVKTRQGEGVSRKMRRYPVQNDANATLVARVYKSLECLDLAEPAGHRKISGSLVTPRFIERMFRYGQQFDVRESHFNDIRDQALRQFRVGIEAAVRVAAPRAGVHLVDVDRGMEPVPVRSPAHPFLVTPDIAVRDYLRRRTRTQLMRAGIRVGLDEDFARAAIADLEPVQCANFDAGNE